MVWTVFKAILVHALMAASMAERDIVWGVLGTGAVANDFTTVLNACEGCQVRAVGSRSAEGAAAFASKHSIPVEYATYEELAADEEIDIIYIASPSRCHVDHSELCLRAGKAVLCEKTMAVDSAGAARVLALAREKRLLFMHGVWTRHFPAVHRLREMIRGGELGALRHITIDFNQAPSASGEAALGEGCLLETGVYPIALLDFIMGMAPERVQATGLLSPGGAERQVSLLCSYGGGDTVAHLHCGLTVGTPREAVFIGTEATAVLPFPFWCPDRLLIKRDGGDQQPGTRVEELSFPLPAVPAAGAAPFNFIHSEGFAYQIHEANRCLREGHIQSESVDEAFNRRLLALVEEARSQVRAAAAAEAGRT